MLTTMVAGAVGKGVFTTVRLPVTRHGDRTPVLDTLHLTKNPHTILRVLDNIWAIRVRRGPPPRSGRRMAGRGWQMMWKSITTRQCSRTPGLVSSPSLSQTRSTRAVQSEWQTRAGKGDISTRGIAIYAHMYIETQTSGCGTRHSPRNVPRESCIKLLFLLGAFGCLPKEIQWRGCVCYLCVGSADLEQSRITSNQTYCYLSVWLFYIFSASLSACRHGETTFFPSFLSFKNELK